MPLRTDDVQPACGDHLLALVQAARLVLFVNLAESLLEFVRRLVELLANFLDGLGVLLPRFFVALVRLAERLFKRLLDGVILLFDRLAHRQRLLVCGGDLAMSPVSTAEEEMHLEVSAHAVVVNAGRVDPVGQPVHRSLGGIAPLPEHGFELGAHAGKLGPNRSVQRAFLSLERGIHLDLGLAVTVRHPPAIAERRNQLRGSEPLVALADRSIRRFLEELLPGFGFLA